MGRCRSCGGNVGTIFEMGEMPLPNRLMATQWDAFEGYDLNLELCSDCELVQIQSYVAPGKMFSDYTYLSSASKPWVREAELLTQRMLPNLSDKSLVVEIASNDGYLLDHYKKWNVPVLGIDPSKVAAEKALLKGIPTMTEFFDFKLAASLPKADVIHAHNVLAHVPDINNFIEGIRVLLKPKGVAIFDVQALEPILEKTLIDNIYHEHIYYFTYTSLADLFGRHDLEAVIEDIPAHGGSLRCWVRKGKEWKSGFYRIAYEAKVPIFPVIFDGPARRIRFCPAFQPTGDYDADLPELLKLYEGVRGIKV